MLDHFVWDICFLNLRYNKGLRVQMPETFNHFQCVQTNKQRRNEGSKIDKISNSQIYRHRQFDKKAIRKKNQNDGKIN